jgi:hypothetical protein
MDLTFFLAAKSQLAQGPTSIGQSVKLTTDLRASLSQE